VIRALLWLFFLADLAGIAWAVRVLVREARRHLSWHLAQRRARRVEPATAPTWPPVVLPLQRAAAEHGLVPETAASPDVPD
jgi:hypothetical protein